MWLSPRTSETNSTKPLLLVCSPTAFVPSSLPALYITPLQRLSDPSRSVLLGLLPTLQLAQSGSPAIAMAHVMPPCSQIYVRSCMLQATR